MQNNECSLRERYQAMDNEQLVALQRPGGLTDQAARVLSEVLHSRSISAEAGDRISEEVVRHLKKTEPTGPAAIGARFFGRLVDAVIIVAMTLIPPAMLGFTETSEKIAYWAALSYFLLADALPSGQSIGKRLVGTKVTDGKTGKPCSMLRSVVRNMTLFLWIIDWAPMFGSRRQRMGDMIARTVVVYKPRVRHVPKL